MTDTEQQYSEVVGEQETVICFVCNECNEDHFRKRNTMFGFFVAQIDCPNCGHIISGECESVVDSVCNRSNCNNE